MLSLVTGKSPEYNLKKVGPWSRQRLVGTQNLADEELPSWTVKLIRNVNGDIQSE
ncbi:MAG: hypothetical protein H6765_04045 [Candidatus Peribacteria bacterium]|nr:MAG: hypothetical protein H6765_04045 [Candidatus Peribacteria bacterium]